MLMEQNSILEAFNKFKNNGTYVSGNIIKVDKPNRSIVIKNGLNTLECIFHSDDLPENINAEIQLFGCLKVDFDGKIYLRVIKSMSLIKKINIHDMTKKYNKCLDYITNDRNCLKRIKSITKMEQPAVIFDMAFIILSDYDSIVENINKIPFGNISVLKCSPGEIHRCIKRLQEIKYFDCIFIIGKLVGNYSVIDISNQDNLRVLLNRKNKTNICTSLTLVDTDLKPLIAAASNQNYDRLKNLFGDINTIQSNYKNEMLKTRENIHVLILNKLMKSNDLIREMKKKITRSIASGTGDRYDVDCMNKLRTISCLTKYHLMVKQEMMLELSMKLNDRLTSSKN